MKPASTRHKAEQLVKTPPGVPGWLLVPAGLAVAFVGTPLIGLVPSVDWPNFWGLITSKSSLTALRLSLQTAAASTLVCLLVGVPLALVLARLQFTGRGLLRTLVLLPLVLPPVVGGVALLTAFGRRGLIGRYLDVVGIQVGFTTLAVVMAQVFVSLPFLVISLEGALRSIDPRVEHIAATLGATPTRVSPCQAVISKLALSSMPCRMAGWSSGRLAPSEVCANNAANCACNLSNWG